MDILKRYGWDDNWIKVYCCMGIAMSVGRITGQYGRFLKCISDEGEILTEVAGRLETQIIAANVDFLCIVSALDEL